MRSKHSGAARSYGWARVGMPHAFGVGLLPDCDVLVSGLGGLSGLLPPPLKVAVFGLSGLLPVESGARVSAQLKLVASELSVLPSALSFSFASGLRARAGSSNRYAIASGRKGTGWGGRRDGGGGIGSHERSPPKASRGGSRPTQQPIPSDAILRVLAAQKWLRMMMMIMMMITIH